MEISQAFQIFCNLGNLEEKKHFFTVVYYSKYDFGDYTCFVVKGDEIYESPHMTVPSSGQLNETKMLSDGLVLTQNNQTTGPLSLHLSCQVSNDEFNSSWIFWLKDDFLIYITDPWGEDLLVEQQFKVKGSCKNIVLVSLFFNIFTDKQFDRQIVKRNPGGFYSCEEREEDDSLFPIQYFYR